MGAIRKMEIYNRGYNNAIDNLFLRLEKGGDNKEYRMVMIRKPYEFDTPAKIKAYNQGYAAGNVFAKDMLKHCDGDIEKTKEMLERYKKF